MASKPVAKALMPAHLGESHSEGITAHRARLLSRLTGEASGSDGSVHVRLSDSESQLKLGEAHPLFGSFSL